MRIAAAQVRCPWLDKAAGTAKVIDYVAKAAKEGCELVAFPETFLSGYPFWLLLTDGLRFNETRQKAAYAAYLEAAVEVGGPEIASIVEAVREHGVFTYLGISERGSGAGRGTVWCSLVAIDPEAGIVGVHRKLMPTFHERLVWGAGDGHGLRTHEVAGVKAGGLICWENWMPQARHALYAAGEELHVSVWPGSAGLTKDIARFIAMEGRVYSLAVGALIDFADMPGDFPFREEILKLGQASTYDGGSCIAGPDGRWIVEPVRGEERLITADIDPALVRGARQTFDAAGHYARPDVFDVTVNRTRLSAVNFSD